MSFLACPGLAAIVKSREFQTKLSSDQRFEDTVHRVLRESVSHSWSNLSELARVPASGLGHIFLDQLLSILSGSEKCLLLPLFVKRGSLQVLFNIDKNLS